jgi:hypothetical protein
MSSALVPGISRNAHQNDFDYLLGDWEFTGVRHEASGELKFRGYWSAVRLDAGAQILDEYRVIGDKGETYYDINFFLRRTASDSV